MNNNSTDIIKRKLLIIQLLLEGKYVSTRQIQEHLATQGIDTKLRSIQRDLAMLEDILPVECRKDDKPYSWRWQKLSNTKSNQLSLSQAIALRLVETELEGVIPNDLYERLEPLFVKSNFVTGLSQIDSWDKLVSQDGPNSESTIHTEQGDNNFRAFPKKNIFPTSPFKSLMMSLRIKYEQRKNLEKINNSKLGIRDAKELKIVFAEEKQLLDDLALNLQEHNLDSLAILLTQ